MSNHTEPSRSTQERLLAGAFAAVVGAAVVAWVWGGVAGVLFGAGWPAVNGGGVAHAVVSLPTSLGDPRRAWPAAVRADLPGPVGFYAALAVLAMLASAAGISISSLRRRDHLSTAGERERRGARWARSTDLKALTASRRRRGSVSETDGARLALGFRGPRLLRAEQRHALVVFGPPQSGKSAGLAIGALLEWPGPVIASSIKTDVLRATIAQRRRLGRVYVFDPFELASEPRSTWSPLRAADTFDGALEVAHRLASAGEVDQRSVESGEFWTVAAEQRLAPLLYAAAHSGKGIDTLVRWAYGQGELELGAALNQVMRTAESEHDRHDARSAFDAASAFTAQPDRTRGSIEGTVQTLLRAYRSSRVQRSARSSEITPDGLFKASNTAYIVGDAKASRLLRPIFLALLGELIDHAYKQANLNGGVLQRPLLLCLDELGNVAPLPNLAEIASTAPSHNIQLVSVFHDLAQARARYGRDAETVINSHRARMLLPGVADLDTLRYFSALVGDQLARDETRTTGPGYQTRSENQTRRPLAPPEHLRQLPAGHALLVYGRLPPVIVRLRMWFNDRPLKALAGRLG
jgi:type IV secretion system protein VirD4